MYVIGVHPFGRGKYFNAGIFSQTVLAWYFRLCAVITFVDFYTSMPVLVTKVRRHMCCFIVVYSQVQAVYVLFHCCIQSSSDCVWWLPDHGQNAFDFFSVNLGERFYTSLHFAKPWMLAFTQRCMLISFKLCITVTSSELHILFKFLETWTEI